MYVRMYYRDLLCIATYREHFDELLMKTWGAAFT